MISSGVKCGREQNSGARIQEIEGSTRIEISTERESGTDTEGRD
jgi:hypothetical protein